MKWVKKANFCFLCNHRRNRIYYDTTITFYASLHTPVYAKKKTKKYTGWKKNRKTHYGPTTYARLFTGSFSFNHWTVFTRFREEVLSDRGMNGVYFCPEISHPLLFVSTTNFVVLLLKGSLLNSIIFSFFFFCFSRSSFDGHEPVGACRHSF